MSPRIGTINVPRDIGLGVVFVTSNTSMDIGLPVQWVSIPNWIVGQTVSILLNTDAGQKYTYAQLGNQNMDNGDGTFSSYFYFFNLVPNLAYTIPPGYNTVYLSQ